MKTPKKVIEKISLPLMFVTFVMAVLMFAVSPVSAAPDCDNPKHQDKPACTGGDGEGSITYTAQLTGAFVFGLELELDAIVDVYPNSKESALLGDPDTPDNISLPMYLPLPLDKNLLATWDQVFNACPVLLDITSFDSFETDDWYISKYGGVRVMFRDFLLPYDHETSLVEDGAVITVQLVGNYFDSDVENFLPVPPLLEVGDLETQESRRFYLTDFVIWGETAHGAPRPRRACQTPGDGGGKRDVLKVTSILKITATRHIP